MIIMMMAIKIFRDLLYSQEKSFSQQFLYSYAVQPLFCFCFLDAIRLFVRRMGSTGHYGSFAVSFLVAFVVVIVVLLVLLSLLLLVVEVLSLLSLLLLLLLLFLLFYCCFYYRCYYFGLLLLLLFLEGSRLSQG